MEKDDLDFSPSPSASSNLATLFGSTKKSLQGNSTLTYTAPKPPKKEASPTKCQQIESANNKPVIIFCKPVQAYKLKNRTYVNQGLAGIAIRAFYDLHNYGIILYKPSKEPFTTISITKYFSLTMCANNYVSFYDSSNQNWSVMFQSSAEVEDFAEKVAISKFFCSPHSSENLIIQDLTPPSNILSFSNSTVDIIYTSYCLVEQSSKVIKENIPESIKLSESNSLLAKALKGCSANSKRIVIIPHNLNDYGAGDLGANEHLLLKINIEKILSDLESSLKTSNTIVNELESPVDSSSEESRTSKAKTFTKETLSATKTQKANLISRMARMGQATLPLKSGLSGGPSDSEEEGSSSASVKPRNLRPKPCGIGHNKDTTSMNSPSNVNYEGAKQLSLYQKELASQQSQLLKTGTPFQQMAPVFASPVLSPTFDHCLSVQLSESRMQAVELRMSIAKISDKIELVLNKMQNISISDSTSKLSTPSLLDTSSILLSIQNLISENESLKIKTEEQKNKLEQQNDKIFHLLDVNQRYLEKNSSSYEKQSEVEIKLRKDIELFLKKEIMLEEDNKKKAEKVKELETQLQKLEENKKELEKAILELTNALEDCKKNLEKNDNIRIVKENCEEQTSKASEIITKLKEKLREVISEKEEFKSMVESQKECIEKIKSEMNELIIKNRTYEKALEDLKNKVLTKEMCAFKENDLKILHEKTEEEKKNLICEVEKERENYKIEMKASFSRIQQSLKKKIEDLQEFSEATVLSTVNDYFNCLIYEENENIKSELPSLSETKLLPEKEESESLDKKDESLNIPEKKDENDVRCSSYDQGWRTTKPPPPSLFDDEDEDNDWLN